MRFLINHVIKGFLKERFDKNHAVILLTDNTITARV